MNELNGEKNARKETVSNEKYKEGQGSKDALNVLKVLYLL